MSDPICHFIVAGCMRSGSSSLNRYLGDHPQVYMVRPKEPHFFDRNFEEGLDWYRQKFAEAPAGALRGESTPSYIGNPTALSRIRETLPDARILVVVRDPVDRAYSHHWMRVGRGRETRSFAEVVEAEMGQHDDYSLIWLSRYRDHLEHLFGLFPRENVLVLGFDDLQNRPLPTFRYVCRFLGVDPERIPPSVGRKVNPSFRARSPRVRRWSQAKVVPKRMRNAIAKLNQVEVQYPPMPTQLRMELDDYFQPHREAAMRAIADTFTQLRLH